MMDNDIITRIERMIEEYILAEGHPPDRMVTSLDFLATLKLRTGSLFMSIGGILVLWSDCVTSNTVYLLNKDETIGAGELVRKSPF